MRQDLRLTETRDQICRSIQQLGWKLAHLQVNIGYPGADAHYSRRKHKHTGNHGVRLALTVGPFWLEAVHAQGLAIVGDELILEATQLDCRFPCEGAWSVRAVYCDGRNYRVRLQQAVRLGGIVRLGFDQQLAYHALLADFHEALTGEPKIHF